MSWSLAIMLWFVCLAAATAQATELLLLVPYAWLHWPSHHTGVACLLLHCLLQCAVTFQLLLTGHWLASRSVM
jgi:hypothetical protein